MITNPRIYAIVLNNNATIKLYKSRDINNVPWPPLASKLKEAMNVPM